MNYKEQQQLFDLLIQENNIKVEGTKTNSLQIISLSGKMIVARKVFEEIPAQYDYERRAILYLKENLGDDYNKYFPYVYSIDDTNKFIYFEKMETDFNYFVSKERGLVNQQHFLKQSFSQIIEQLIIMHQLNIVHGDIKTENILLDTNHQIKLCDFGHSMIVPKNNPISNDKKGTCGYVDNELFKSWELNKYPYYNQYKFDTFSLGATLFFSLHFVRYPSSKCNIFLKAKNCEQRYWSELIKAVPDVEYWSQELKKLFMQLIHPKEDSRIFITELFSDSQAGMISKKVFCEQEDSKENQIEIEDNSHFISLSDCNRGSSEDTIVSIENAKKHLISCIKELEDEDFEDHLHIEDANRKAKIIGNKALMKSDFKSQLDPQQILIILLVDAQQYFSNWKEEGFLDSKEYFIKARYDYQEEDIQTKEGVDIEEIDDEEELEDLIESKIQNKSLYFELRIWRIDQQDQSTFNTWVDFILVKGQDSFKFNEIVYKISNIIQSF